MTRFFYIRQLLSLSVICCLVSLVLSPIQILAVGEIDEEIVSDAEKKLIELNPHLLRSIQVNGISGIHFARNVHKNDLWVEHDIERTTKLPNRDQGASGDCWLYSAEEVFLFNLRKKTGLQIRLSPIYLSFWNRFETANIYFEHMISLGVSGTPITDFEFYKRNRTPTLDGGNLHRFIDLVEKYGVVTEEAMPETTYSKASWGPNAVISGRIHQSSVKLYKLAKAEGERSPTLIAKKKQFLSEIYVMLVAWYGQPPKSFHVRKKDLDAMKNALIENREEAKEKETDKTELSEKGVVRMTPKEVYSLYKKISTDMEQEYVTITFFTHLPQIKYRYKGLGDYIGGRNFVALNVSVDEALCALRESIRQGDIAEIGIDVSQISDLDRDRKFLVREDNMMNDIFGLENHKFTIIDKMRMGLNESNHGMVVVGCDEADSKRIVNTESETLVGPLWKFKNTWGEKFQYMYTTEKTFKDKAYSLFIPIKHLPEHLQELARGEVEKEFENWEEFIR